MRSLRATCHPLREASSQPLRSLPSSPAGGPPGSLDAVLPSLLAQGVCLILPGYRMPVPIPLDEGQVTAAGQFVWATGHTLFGPSRPQVGQLEFVTWQFDSESNGRCELLDRGGEVIARLVPTNTLALPAARAERLQSEFARHRQRVSADGIYASRWAQRLREFQRALGHPGKANGVQDHPLL